MLKIVPLGGLGEIGLNMMVIEFGDDILVVDAGLMFPEDYMLGVDFAIPDMEYIRDRRSSVRGVVLTHAHEDHIGALPFLLKDMNVPVFATAFTLGVIEHKLEERDLLSSAKLNQIYPRKRFQLGPFDIEPISVNHSVVDGVGLAVRTPRGLIVHTGDFKISHTISSGSMTDVNSFARCGDEGVLALLSDSTNVEKGGYTISDKQIGETLDNIITNANGRCIVGLFASSINRIQQIVSIAAARRKKVVFNGKSIEISVKIARDLGYIQMDKEMEIDVEQVDQFPDHKIVIITTGSQGEPMSALARMASGTHKQVKIHEGDTVILSSKFIPGNERAIAKIINDLYRRGADVIYEKISDIHVSGHAFREELKMMIRLVRPEYFIPIHGEYRHLVLHAKLAADIGTPKDRIIVAENGQAIVFDDSGGYIEESIPTGRVLIDGKGIGDVGRSILKERRALSEDGIVAVTMALDEETGIIIYGPEIVSRGFVFETETGYLLQDAICVILEIVEDIGPEEPNRIDKIRSRLQADLRKYFNFTIKRRPIILPFILEV